MPCMPLKPNARTRRSCSRKDIWVVATLGVLFDAPFGHQLVFKGGTSLSKVWARDPAVLGRHRQHLRHPRLRTGLVAGAGDEALPLTRSQERRWTKAGGRD